MGSSFLHQCSYYGNATCADASTPTQCFPSQGRKWPEHRCKSEGKWLRLEILCFVRCCFYTKIKSTHYNRDWSYQAIWRRKKVCLYLIYRILLLQNRKPIGTLVCAIGGPCFCWWSRGIVVTVYCGLSVLWLSLWSPGYWTSSMCPRWKDTAANVTQEWQPNIFWSHFNPKKQLRYQLIISVVFFKEATTTMNSKTIFHLLLAFSLFTSCLPAPKHFLVETEAKGKIDIGKKQVVGPFKIFKIHYSK